MYNKLLTVTKNFLHRVGHFPECADFHYMQSDVV